MSIRVVRVLGSHTLHWGCEILFSASLKPRSHECGEELKKKNPLKKSITQLWHFLPHIPVHLFPTECCCLKWDAWGFCRCWGTRWNKNASHLAPKLQERWTGANISWHTTSWNGHQLRSLSSFKTAGSFFTPWSALLPKPAAAPLVEFSRWDHFP